MTPGLDALGFDGELAAALATLSTTSTHPLRAGRVASVARGMITAWTAEGEVCARVRPQSDPLRRPAVGDWVAIRGVDSPRVVALLPRRTRLVRKAPGRAARPQLIAANLDIVVVVTALDGDLRERRLERFVRAIHGGGARAAIVLSKVDLWEGDTGPALAIAARANPGGPVVLCSAPEGRGVEDVLAMLPSGSTGAFVGTSGVGKSTLLNALVGREAMATAAVRASDRRGVHTTTRRAMFVLPGDRLVVDTPGMRELEPWDVDALDGFDDLDALAGGCRFRDCRHAGEPGCAIEEAVATGALDGHRVGSWRKLQRELARQRRRVEAKARRRRSGRRG